MVRFWKTLLMISVVTLFLGCGGGTETPKGKELEELQKQGQQKADEEEKAYQKEQKMKK